MRTSIYLLTLCTIVTLQSCYKPYNPPDNSPFTYRLVFGAAHKTPGRFLSPDTVNYFETKYDTAYRYRMYFLANTGNPANVTMQAYVTGLPADAHQETDTFTFMLNGDLYNSFTLKPGMSTYTFTVNAVAAGHSPTSYAVMLSVKP